VEFNVVISGVGGQGILTAEHLLAQTALRKGYKVRAGEIHGLAQRFGSVVAFVRFGDTVYGGSVPDGMGDIILGFEPVETMRYINFVKDGGVAIVNTKKIPPVQVSMGLYEYPTWDEIKSWLDERNIRLIGIPAEDLALKAGSALAVNTVMVGAAIKLELLPFSPEDIKDTIRDIFPQKLHDLNFRAFDLGYEAEPEII